MTDPPYPVRHGGSPDPYADLSDIPWEVAGTVADIRANTPHAAAARLRVDEYRRWEASSLERRDRIRREVAQEERIAALERSIENMHATIRTINATIENVLATIRLNQKEQP